LNYLGADIGFSYLRDQESLVPRRKLIAFMGQSNNGLGPSQETSLLTTLLPSTYNTPFTPVTLAMIAASSNTDPIPFLGPFTTGPIASYVGANGSDQFGPDFSLSRYLNDAQSTPEWAMCKFAIASSSLAQWLPTSTYPTSPGGSPNAFTQAVNFWKAQEIALNGNIVAFVSCSGETDSQDATLSANYNANQSAILAGLRAIWPSAPFVIYELGSSTGQTFTSTVRTQEASFISGNTNVYMFNVDDLSMVGGTGVHFTADSLVTLGRRFGKQILSALSIDVRPVASFTIAPSGLTVAFTDTSTDDDGTITAWNWDFGDGNHSTSQNPSHTYASSGPYTVSLTVEDDSGKANLVPATKTVLPAWTVDSGNGIGYPASSTEWAAANAVDGGATPTDQWGCQDTTGNAADGIGSNAAVVNGAVSWTYSDTFGSANRKALTVADGSSTARFLYNSSPSASTNSIAFMVDVLIPTAPSAERSIASYGGLDVRVTTGGLLKCVNGSNTITGTQSIVGTRVRILMLHDVTNSRHMVYTPGQRLTVPWATSTATFFSWGKGGDSSANCKYAQVQLWIGSGAEMTDVVVRNRLKTLGDNVTW
jgi:hypothetical protein